MCISINNIITYKTSKMAVKSCCILIKSLLVLLLLATVVVVWGCGENENFINKRERLENPKVYSFIRVGEAQRVKRSIRERQGCGSKKDTLLNRVDTTVRLGKLRDVMRQENLDAFLVPSGDSHQSEYIADADKRLLWITGFSGSNGFAVITLEKAAMWTDGRYFIQAENELDCNWLFKKGAEHNDVSWSQWLANNLMEGSNVGADPSLTGAHTWLDWEEQLKKSDLSLIPVDKNLIDQIWTNSRPLRSTAPLEIHDIEFSGLSWQDKVYDLRKSLSVDGHDAIVLTALDEIAWLFNMRGKDIPYNPVFRAYAIVESSTTGRIILYLPPDKQSSTVKKHLNSEECYEENKDVLCVEIEDYEDIFDELPELIQDQGWATILLGKKSAYSGGGSYAIYRLIPESKLRLELSPVMLTKASKNEVEVAGMKKANIYDAVALIEFASVLEDGIADGEEWDELKAAKKLASFRRKQPHNRGLSFPSISAYGANGAIIHYQPNNITNTKIEKNALYLLDSGGQYLYGTTDVTRTFHFGQPSDFEREAYTRVLAGSIDLARAIMIEGVPDNRIDILARWNLWRVGLNYNHGTGHGIGAYGFIHESPVQVRVYGKEAHPIKRGYFFSDEPGYYEAGKFGIRLETVLQAVAIPEQSFPHGVKDEASGGGLQYIRFEPVCLVPFEPKLIDYNLLNKEQLDWLSNYNAKIRQHVGNELKKQGKNQRIIDWMMVRTEPITEEYLRKTQHARVSDVRGVAAATMIIRGAATNYPMFILLPVASLLLKITY